MCLELNRICGLPLTLQDLRVNPADFGQVAETALNDGAMIVNPKKADKKDVLRILDKAYGK